MTMHLIFPYASKPVSITQNMCDHNGHMNVLFYSQIFGESMDDFYAGTLGFSGEYFDSGTRGAQSSIDVHQNESRVFES